MKKSKIKMYISIFFSILAAVTVGMPASLSSGAGSLEIKECPTYCNCEELQEIEYRIIEVLAAIEGFKAEIHSLQSKKASFKWSQDEYDKIKGRIVPQINKRLDEDGFQIGNMGGGDTNGITCGITIDYRGSAKCVEESLRRHELVHQEKCIKVTGREGVTGSISGVGGAMSKGSSADYSANTSMVDFLQEDISAYEKELDFLNKEKDFLEKYCSKNSLTASKRKYMRGEEPKGGEGRDYTCRRKKLSKIGLSDTVNETFEKMREMAESVDRGKPRR